MIAYVCKYTPIELFMAYGEECQPLSSMGRDYPLADASGHINLCGYGKAVLENILEGKVDSLVLVNCCDVMRKVYDIARESGKCRFLYLLDLPHGNGGCAVEYFHSQLLRLKERYESAMGGTFDKERFLSSFKEKETFSTPYVAIVGARAGSSLEKAVREGLGEEVRNLTCLGNREVEKPEGDDILLSYAAGLLLQIPCRRMGRETERRVLYQDPKLKGLVFHAMKFCDFSQWEYQEQKPHFSVPSLRIETDYTLQSEGQLSTRLEAFGETLGKEKKMKQGKGNYVAGIDSGSTSTDVVVMDKRGTIIAQRMIPTGGGAEKSANECLSLALLDAAIPREELAAIVTTGYGRDFLSLGEGSLTEISCHAKGAHHLDSQVRTVIDIGGQDSKVIRMDGNGKVVTFVMNDKCAAGTGRFLEMMARALGLSIDQMARLGDQAEEALSISSMCTVFAESEVVSLVAQNRKVGDIVHAIDDAVAMKTSVLVKRVGLEEKVMFTGGVARNAGLVHALERKLSVPLVVLPSAPYCGAIGAALFALEG